MGLQMKLAGKTAIVTGGSQGMGAAFAFELHGNGANVVLTDVKTKQGEAIAADLGVRAMFIEHDVTDEDGWSRVVSETKKAFGSIDILVNNAGIVGVVSETTSLDLQTYQTICGVNQTAVFLGMRAVIPAMREVGGGSIINISSIAGMLACLGSPNLAYVASKFAIRGMTKHVALEVAAQNIRVNSIHPGYVKTPMNEDAIRDGGEAALKVIPMHRFGQPNEVAKLVVFLASDDSSFITGSEHIIDGGMIAG